MGKGHKGKKQRRQRNKKKKGRGQHARIWTESLIVSGNGMKLRDQVKRIARIRCIHCGWKFHTEDTLKAHMCERQEDVIRPMCKICCSYHEVADDCMMEESSKVGPSKFKGNSAEEDRYNSETHLDSEEDEKGEYGYDSYEDNDYD